MDTRQPIRAVWGYRWWLALFVVVAAGAVYFVSNSRAPTYQAKTIVRVVPSAEASGQILTADQIQSLTNTYLQLAQTQGVYGRAGQIAKVSPSALSSQLGVDAGQDSAVFTLTGRAAAPATAATYANAYASGFTAFVDSLQQGKRNADANRVQGLIKNLGGQLAALPPGDPRGAQIRAQMSSLNTKLSEAATASGDTVQVLEQALPPEAPASPRPTRDAILALVAALILGAAAIYARIALVDRYAGGEDAASDLGLSLLGEIPRGGPREQPVIEAFRRLRTSVVFALGSPRAQDGRLPGGRDEVGFGADGHESLTILVTAAERGAGKSYVTTNLSRALAADGWRVVAVDGDLRRPTLHAQFDVKARPGLAEVLGQRTVHLTPMVAQSIPIPDSRSGREGDLKVVTAGTPISDSTERLSSQYMVDAMDALRADHDFVVLDSSPLGPVVDAAVLARYSRGVVLVVDARRSRRRAARRAAAALRSIDAPILGIVYNRGSAASSYEVYGSVEPAAELEPEAAR